MRITILASFLSLLGIQAQAEDCVILLHGLGRTSLSMQVMGLQLRAEGYRAHAINYPSRSKSIPDLAKQVTKQIAKKCRTKGQVHFVTHSMGGILLRYSAEYLPDRMPKNMGRSVMLGPPNRGSEIVDEHGDTAWFRFGNGEAGISLGTDAESWPSKLGSFPHEFGVIAGNKSIEPYWSGIIEGENDGKVSVESTKLEGMDDHIVMPVTHTFMVNDPDVARQTISFLKAGKFQHEVKGAD